MDIDDDSEQIKGQNKRERIRSDSCSPVPPMKKIMPSSTQTTSLVQSLSVDENETIDALKTKLTKLTDLVRELEQANDLVKDDNKKLKSELTSKKKRVR